MKENEDYLVCFKHNKTQPLNDRFAKNVYICVNKYCPNSFELACVKCRTEFHKDHVVKFLTLESFKTLLSFLTEQQPKKSSQDGYDYYKRLKLIRQFRRKMQAIQSDLTQTVDDVIMTCIDIDSQYTDYKGQIEENQISNSNFASKQSVNQTISGFKQISGLIDYNLKKGVLQFQSTRLKQMQQRVRKLLDKSGKQMQQMKEYTMKIIEVILHQPQSDDELQINLIRKKFKTYMQIQADNAGLKSQYKDIIDDLVDDLTKKSNQLDDWLQKAQLVEPGIRQHYKDSIFVKVYQIAEQNIQIHKQNQSMSKQLQDARYQLQDLRKKVTRMNERMNQIKRALLEQDQKFRTLKVQYEKATGKQYTIPECSVNLQFWKSQVSKLSGMAQQKANILKNKVSKLQQKQSIISTRYSKQHTLQPQKDDSDHTISTLKTQQCRQNILTQSRLATQQKRIQLINQMMQVISKQQKTNDQWVSICHQKNETIQSLRSKLKSLIDYSRKMILSS